MGDADILAKLSRILETHNLSGDNEEESTNIEDILHNISVEAGIRFEDYDDDDLSRIKSATPSLPKLTGIGKMILSTTRSPRLMKFGKLDRKKNSS
jgi:hypothetical protein